MLDCFEGYEGKGETYWSEKVLGELGMVRCGAWDPAKFGDIFAGISSYEPMAPVGDKRNR